MADYRISGIWLVDGEITGYAFHRKGASGLYGRAIKKNKAAAVALVEGDNTVKTWMWNYTASFWQDGQNVHVVNGNDGKFLRTTHDGSVRDNLGHLLDYDWLPSN